MNKNQEGKLLTLGEIDGKTFVCGDIHGCYEDLVNLLSDANFDHKSDRLICTGDLIDRGPDSELCMDLVNQPWFYTCMGNHEAIALECTDGDFCAHKAQWWVSNGGGWYYNAASDLIKDTIKNNFYTLPLGIEVAVNGKIVAVTHADPVFDDWEKTKEVFRTLEDSEYQSNPVHQTCLWSRERVAEIINISGCDLMVHGHTIQVDPVRIANRLLLDTGSFMRHYDYCEGRISLICLDEYL